MQKKKKKDFRMPKNECSVLGTKTGATKLNDVEPALTDYLSLSKPLN